MKTGSHSDLPERTTGEPETAETAARQPEGSAACPATRSHRQIDGSALTSKERSLAERLDRILRDPYVANRAMAQTILEARDALSDNSRAPTEPKREIAGLSKYARDWLVNMRRESGGYPAEVLRHINILEEDVMRAERIADHLGEERDRLHRQLLQHAEVCGESAYRQRQVKPTIADLEKILQSEDTTPVTILPDGTIVTAPSAEETKPEKAPEAHIDYNVPGCGCLGCELAPKASTHDLCTRDDGHDWDDDGCCLHCAALKPVENGRAE